MQRLYIYSGLAVVAILAGFWGWKYPPVAQFFGWQTSAPSSGPVIGGAFSLTDQNGNTVTDVDLRGRYLLVFFGYTYCPDVCPTALQTVADALDTLGTLSKKVQPVFISVDPQRDTPQVLRDYVRNFHPSLIGLTGTPDQIAGAARAYRIYFAKVKDEETGPDDYLMNHSAIIYLMGPEGEFVTHFTHGTTPEEMATTLRKYL